MGHCWRKSIGLHTFWSLSMTLTLTDLDLMALTPSDLVRWSIHILTPIRWPPHPVTNTNNSPKTLPIIKYQTTPTFDIHPKSYVPIVHHLLLAIFSPCPQPRFYHRTSTPIFPIYNYHYLIDHAFTSYPDLFDLWSFYTVTLNPRFRSRTAYLQELTKTIFYFELYTIFFKRWT